MLGVTQTAHKKETLAQFIVQMKSTWNRLLNKELSREEYQVEKKGLEKIM